MRIIDLRRTSNFNHIKELLVPTMVVSINDGFSKFRIKSINQCFVSCGYICSKFYITCQTTDTGTMVDLCLSDTVKEIIIHSEPTNVINKVMEI